MGGFFIIQREFDGIEAVPHSSYGFVVWSVGGSAEHARFSCDRICVEGFDAGQYLSLDGFYCSRKLLKSGALNVAVIFERIVGQRTSVRPDLPLPGLTIEVWEGKDRGIKTTNPKVHVCSR